MGLYLAAGSNLIMIQMILYLSVVLLGLAYALVGKLNVRAIGKQLQLKCLKKTSYLYRNFQTMVALIKYVHPVKIVCRSIYEDISTSLDWIKQSPAVSSESTLLVILPNITGTSRQNIIIETARTLQPFYSDICVYNCALLNNLPKKHPVDLISNLKFVLEDLKLNYRKIHCVGFGFGANQLVSYLGSKTKVVVDRSVVVSNPFDLGMCSEMMGGFQDWRLTVLIKHRIQKMRDNFASFDLDWEKIGKAKRLVEIDQHFTTQVCGYRSVKDYHKALSSGQYVKNVTSPVLSISSRDDQISSYPAIHFSETISYLITDKGGHNAFLDWGMRFWFLQPLKEYMLMDMH